MVSMEYFLSISSKTEIVNTSEVGWISKNYFIVTVNNDYYVVKLNNHELIRVSGGIQFGRQQLSSQLFCSLIRKPRNYKHHSGKRNNKKTIQTFKMNAIINTKMIES